MIGIHYSKKIYCPAVLCLKVKRIGHTSYIKHENEVFLLNLTFLPFESTDYPILVFLPICPQK